MNRKLARWAAGVVAAAALGPLEDTLGYFTATQSLTLTSSGPSAVTVTVKSESGSV